VCGKVPIGNVGINAILIRFFGWPRNIEKNNTTVIINIIVSAMVKTK